MGLILPPDNKFAPVSECKSLSTGFYSTQFLFIIIAGLTTLNGLYLMGSYKLTGFIIDDKSDDLLTLAATVGFLMFGVFRLLTRTMIKKTGFFIVFIGYVILNVQQLINTVNIDMPPVTPSWQILRLTLRNSVRHGCHRWTDQLVHPLHYENIWL